MQGRFRGLEYGSIRATVREALPTFLGHPGSLCSPDGFSCLLNITSPPTLHLSLQHSTGLLPGRAASQPWACAGSRASRGGNYYSYFYVPTVCQALCQILRILLASQLCCGEEPFLQ